VDPGLNLVFALLLIIVLEIVAPSWPSLMFLFIRSLLLLGKNWSS
jgi:hypothetical protein